MASVSLAKALKLKKRLAGRIDEVKNNIRTYNSIQDGQTRPYDIHKLNEEYVQLAQFMVALKMALYKGNLGIQEKLFVLGEYKGAIEHFKAIPTRQGTVKSEYNDTEITYTSVLDKLWVDGKVKEYERLVDATQDDIDIYNNSTKVEVPSDLLSL